MGIQLEQMKELAGCLDPFVDRKSKCVDRKSKWEDEKSRCEDRK